MHARLGGLSKSKDLILSVHIAGSKEILEVGEDDEAEIYNVLRAIKADHSAVMEVVHSIRIFNSRISGTAIGQ
jgi:hypothetical protein